MGVWRGVGLGVACVLSLASSAARGADGPKPLRADVGVEWAVGTRDGETQKLQLRVEPELSLALPAGMRLGGAARLRGDAFDELEPGSPDQPEVQSYTRRLGFGDRADAELRELWVQGQIGRVWLRAGKQQVVWGQADGLKVLDVVDPQSFEEFILPKFEDSRIPLWTLNGELKIGAAQLQLLWIPDPSAHDLPPQSGTFAITAPRFAGPPPPRGVAVRLEDADRPDDPLRDSDVGARLSGFWKGWGLSANALWHYDDIPIPFRTIELRGGVPAVTVRPGYRRTAVLGGSASSAFGNLAVRGELAAQLARFVPTADAADRDGVVRTTDVGWVLGLDWYGFADTLISAQLFQSALTAHDRGMQRDLLETTITLLARRQLLHETLVVETIWLHGVNDGDGLVRPRIEYALRDDLQIWLGADVFYGPRRGLFGEFDQDDRVVVGFEWGL
jgi:hypothetical protein